MIKKIFGLTEENFLKEIMNEHISEKRLNLYLEKKININPLDEEKNPIIFKLIQKKKKENIKTLLSSKNFNILIKNKHNKNILEEAVDREEKEIVKLILENKFDVNTKNDYGKTILHDIALFDEKIFMTIKEYNPNYSIQDNKGKTPIFYTIYHNNLNIFKIMINNMKDEELNITDIEGKSILSEAIENKNIEYIKELLERDIDINILNSENENILYKLIEQGDSIEEILEILINKGINLNQKNKKNETILEKIFDEEEKNKEFSFEKIKEIILIKNRININEKDKNGKTIIEKQIFKKKYENIELLIKFGANINIVDEDGLSILYKEIIKGISNYKMIDLLLKNGVDLNNKNEEQKNIIEQIVEIIGISKGLLKERKNEHFKINKEEKYELILKKLLIYKPNLEIRENGQNILFDLVQYNDFETLKILINSGANINIKDKEEKTPFMRMIEEGLKIENRNEKDLFIERIVNLLKYRVEIDEQDKDGKTVLHKAVIADDLEVVEKLLSKKSDLNKKDIHGRTAIQHTQWTGNYKIARWFISLGANINTVDNTGYSLLNYAAILGHDKLVMILIKAGVLMYNKSPKNKKATEYFKSKEKNLEKLVENNHTSDEKMINALKEVIENLKKEIHS